MFEVLLGGQEAYSRVVQPMLLTGIGLDVCCKQSRMRLWFSSDEPWKGRSSAKAESLLT